MTNFTHRVKETLGKHFVTLSCIQYPPNGLSKKPHIFSGFVVDVSGEWFFVTAGHIIRSISEAFKAGSLFDIWRLDDQTAGNDFNGMAVPYDFDFESWLIIRDETNGLDYAAAHLDNFYRSQLEAGGVIAINKNSWSDHVTEYDHWVLVGVPSESISYDEVAISARLVVTPLIAANEPNVARDKAQNQFYAKPTDGFETYFRDADGLSGGPVFLLKKVQDEWIYSVIGVQSAWYSSTKTLAICPFSSFGFALEEMVESSRSI